MGGREVFFRGVYSKPSGDKSFQMIELLPALDDYNQIIGSQLIYTGDEQNKLSRRILVFENAQEAQSCVPSSILIKS